MVNASPAPRPAQTAVVGLPPADASPEVEAVAIQLRQATTQAAQAKRNVAALQERLRAQGQQLRSDILESTARVDAFLDQARVRLEAGDVGGAQEDISRATYSLRQVTQAVGR